MGCYKYKTGECEEGEDRKEDWVDEGKHMTVFPKIKG